MKKSLFKYETENFEMAEMMALQVDIRVKA